MGDYLPLSGGTVTGDTIFTSGLTATTISATTYQNLPIDPDTYTTGFTYNTNVFTIKQNNGQPDLTATINSVTGWTVNGDLIVTGNTSVQGLTATTISATTYSNLPNTFYTGDGTLSGNRTVDTSTYTLNFSSSSNPNTLVMSGGSVGIGTSSPSQKLEVNGDALIRNAYIGNITAFGTNYMSFSHISRAGTNDYSLLSDNAGITYLNAKSGQSLNFRIDNIDKVMIASSGNLLIGTTTDSGIKLDVNGDGRFIGGLTATTISATTYQNLPVDPDSYVTGFTLNSDIITLSQNRNDPYSAFTISLSAYTGNTGVSGDYLPLSGGTVTGDTIFTSGLTATTISGGTYVGDGSQLSIANSSTGTTITFTAGTIYNSPTSAATGNISADTTNSKIGIVQKIYHNDSVSPTFNPSGWVKLGIGSYTTSTLNIIYAEWVSGSRIEYWITQ
jgi:enamine deaminase RidA (YjgF/YER057c/UK114 family)